MTIKILSLFSGCGGLDLGLEGDFWCLKKSIAHSEWIQNTKGQFVKLEPTGFKTVFANDIRPDAQKAWINFWKDRTENPEEIYHLESIVELVRKSKEENIFPQDIDIVTGGFPCNDFSISGKRLGFSSHKNHLGELLRDDEPTIESRGMLYMWMRDVITITKPKMFIAENVRGLTDLSGVKEIIEHDFSQAGDGGYLVVPARVLQAADYGVPQSRERVFFFGFRKNALAENIELELTKEKISSYYDPYPEPTHTKENYVTCKDAFVRLKEPDKTSDPSQAKYSKAKFMGRENQGQKEVNPDGISPTIRAEHHGNIEYRRLSQEHGGKNKKELKAGLKERRLTVRECARLQTFPDDYEFIIQGVSASNAYKIIGNAVPPVLAYNIAQNIKTKWNRYFSNQRKEEQNAKR